MSEVLTEIRNAVLAGDEEQVKALVDGALAEAIPVRRILEEAMMPAMEEIGGRFAGVRPSFRSWWSRHMPWKRDGYPEIPARRGSQGPGKVILGTVEGDIHSIGKNLVRMCLEGAGFEVIDLG